jgi:inner membrane protein
MDSLTQALLGAACGEAVFGRKIGNKAITWGAIAGTIPDLDVVSRVFLNHPVDELVYHRGFTHSILFTIAAPLLMAWMGRNARHWLLTLFFLSLYIFIVHFAFEDFSLFRTGLAISLTGLGFFLIRKWFINHKIRWSNEPSFGEWYIMFFFAILTHWLIDACTSYGTQIFEPFSSYRISFNNIGIVDPLYTVPLLLFLVILRFYKDVKTRTILNWTGLGLSTAYMAFTFYAKSLADSAFKQSLAEQKISYSEFISYPTIFNSLLWQTTVMADSTFYYGVYSIFDKDKKIEFIQLPMNQNLLQNIENEHYVKILKWFAQGYYNVEDLGNGTLAINNLRFGLLGFGMVEGLKVPYIFRYELKKTESKKLEAIPVFPDPNKLEINILLGKFWKRIWGEKSEKIQAK